MKVEILAETIEACMSFFARLIVVGCLLCPSAMGFAQSQPRVAPPQEVMLTTKDGVTLAATYYKSSKGREAVPIVMLHDHKEQRTIFNALASALQAPSDERVQSHAVLTVDLRGHGGSTLSVDANGETVEIDAAKLLASDFEDMVTYDMEAVRKFLVDRNDAQELNLNKLVLVGAGMGANVATIWAGVDWDAPPLPQRKQGQDVKALVLSSPNWRQKGLPLANTLKHPAVRQDISVMLVYGSQESKAKESAETIYKNFQKFHPEPPIDRVRELKDLFDYPLPTTLQGSKLLVDPQFNMLPNLDNFLKFRLVDQPFPWVQRRLP
jgi:pimeloyl-ACP methyl ester carboxylesterase